MKVKIENERLWEMARYYNTMSHEYSVLADHFTKLAQGLEDEDDGLEG